MAQIEGLRFLTQEMGFTPESVRMSEAVLGVLGERILTVEPMMMQQKEGLRQYRLAMDKVVNGVRLGTQEKALLEYAPWALLGRLLAVTRGAGKFEPGWIQDRDEMVTALGWGDDLAQVEDRLNQRIDRVFERLEADESVDVAKLVQHVMGINTALFASTAESTD
ncbi:MAG: hypothetical protein BWY29_00121 [Microgenomates group bacterium ADurb.Bin238]|nr:MAG: hypothetical protein BWY29_00121 [Microgenomates group bacterium ADurb.Bin238]